MKIVVFRYDAEIVTALSIGYHECCSRGFLCGGSVTEMPKKFPARRSSEETLKRGFFV
jgi:hypothetical protein